MGRLGTQGKSGEIENQPIRMLVANFLDRVFVSVSPLSLAIAL
jgi:hypothetical protein